MSDGGDIYKKETRMIHGKKHSPHWSYKDHIVPPISASATYRLETTARGARGFRQFANPEFNRELHTPIYIYDRLDEPSRGMLEENIELAEGGAACVAFATGMSAISAALGVLLKAHDTLISHKTIYGCTFSLLTNWFPRLGIKVRFADLKDVDAVGELLREEPRTMAVFAETPCNPTLDLLDLRAIADRVNVYNADRPPRRQVYTVVDNTFATPFCQRPLEHGIDVVVNSLTKNIGGFGTDMGGAVVAPKLLEPDLLLYRKDFGAALSPKTAWPPLVYGLPTLALRARHQMATAMQVARFLEAHPAVQRVSYPGLTSHPQHALARRQMRDFEGEFAPGTMIYFVLKGDAKEGRVRGARLMDILEKEGLTTTLAVSLGQIRTLIEHPASMTHAALSPEDQLKAGVEPGGIRISIGLEHPEDIIMDFEKALRAAGK